VTLTDFWAQSPGTPNSPTPFLTPRKRATKIVCTLGPATPTVESIMELIVAGMDVARLNFSHGTYEDHANTFAMVREASDRVGKAVGILADLQGPKIRLGKFANGPVVLVPGQLWTITTEKRLGDIEGACTSYRSFATDVKAGDPILIDDGLLQLEALSTDGVAVVCRVIEGGKVSDRKGINLPGVAVSEPALTVKDAEDLRFALTLRVDFVALSFVRSAEDIKAVHAVMDSCGARLPVIAKIEKPEAVADLENIVAAFDALMVARGDLGVEMALEDVPEVQKRVIRMARAAGKPVIVATQMLESMITNPRPTRAEASDVANAVIDGADAIMLSAETGVGKYPVAAVQTMDRIAAASRPLIVGGPENAPSSINNVQAALARVADDVADTLHAAALVAFTETGSSARLLARERPRLPLLAFTSQPVTRSQLALSWGVETFVVPRVDSTDDMVRQVNDELLRLERAQVGDIVVIVAGTPPGTAGSTNTLRVHTLAVTW
jgi:pyruvate kinase